MEIMQAESKAIVVLVRFLRALELPLPTTAPRVEPVPVGAFMVHWPGWQALVGKPLGQPERVVSLLRLSSESLLRVPVPKTPALQKARAAKLARALELPRRCRLVTCSEKELIWERPTPGNYPIYDRRALRLSLYFSVEDGQLIQARDTLYLLDGAQVPALNVSAATALARAKALIAFTKRAGEAPLGSPTLAWTPFLGELTPKTAQQRLNEPQARSRTEPGPLRLAWLVRWSWCTVGIDPSTGKPIYFSPARAVGSSDRL